MAKQDPFVGTRIREYEILEIIGKGGMGAVYRARHIYLDEIRAIKIIHSRFAEDKNFVERFMREAKILARLDHPNLVTIHEFGTLEDQEVFFMVLEYLQGETVLERIHRLEKIPAQDGIKIIREVALGLHSAHQGGIIHRDISPDNLLLVKDETGHEMTKVIDFGIAKPNFDESHHLTATNFFMGKPEYCSPEQCGLLKDGEIIDRRSDIYSLGVTFYYMLAGKRPFYSATPHGYLLKHVNEQPKPLSAHLAPGMISAKLDRIVLKALAKRRADRYSTMEEFARDLEEFSTTEVPEPAVEVQTEPAASIHPGDIFARRYIVETKLGEGGMGSVFKAQDKILGVPVALKIMNPKFLNNERIVERFKREVILARKVGHRNVCRIYNMDESAGILYVSMEYLEGKTLAETLQTQGALSIEVGLTIIHQVLEGLQEAHRVGIIHRDLKPQNIMLDPNSRASIMDFGISISAGVQRVTQTGALIGTVHYMAPEQVSGKEIDSRSDIYAMGIIMFETFVGRLPFLAESPMAVVVAHMKNLPPKPSEIIPTFNKELEKIILKALEKDPQNRFQDVKEMLEALEMLEGITPGAFRYGKEVKAHRLLAAKSYAKAITYIKEMLQKSPNNEDWKKFLEFAVAEKTKSDMRRVKSLIKKRNFVQTQLLLRRIERLNQGNTRVTSQVRKLESQLTKERQKAVGAHIQEAGRLRDAKDWEGALKQLAAASNLAPNEHSVLKLAKQVELFRKEEESQLETNKIRGELQLTMSVLNPEMLAVTASNLKKLQGVIQDTQFRNDIQKIQQGIADLNSFFEKGDYGKVAGVVEQLYSEDVRGWLHPYKESFALLSDLAEQKLSTKIQELLGQGRQFYDRSSWQEAIDAWKQALEIHPNEASLKQWISSAEGRLKAMGEIRNQLLSRLEECEPLLSGRKFEAVRAILQEAEKATSLYDVPGLKDQLAALDGKLQKAVEETHQELLREQLREAEQMYQKEDFRRAIQKVEQLLKTQPNFPGATALRQRIGEAIRDRDTKLRSYREAFESGMACFEAKQWEKALDFWARAQKYHPQDKSLNQWIEEAKNKLVLERKARSRMDLLIKRVEQQIAANNLTDAEKALQDAQRLATTPELLGNYQSQLDILRDRLAQAIEGKTASKGRIQQVTSQTQELFASEVQSLLKQEGSSKEEQQFLSLFQQGVFLLQEKLWRDAAACFQQADEIRPGHQPLQEHLRTATERLGQQQQLETILAMVAEGIDDGIKQHDWDEVFRLTNYYLNQDYSDFLLETQLSRIRDLASKAESLRAESLLNSPKVTLAQLTWNRPDGEVARFALTEEEHTIGRGRLKKNSIKLDDPGVSSTHARIVRAAEGYILEDLHSTNGTFVNEIKIVRHALQDKDRIRFGSAELVYTIVLRA